MNEEREKKLRKKLFIGGAYLVVALLLLIYVSYSAYRIKISARVLMPEALTQAASLDIKLYSQRQGYNNDSTGIVLNNLMPNERAQDYVGNFASASEAGRAVKFSISNASLLNSGQLSPDITQVKEHYKINFVETGVVPLEGILVDDAGNTYKVTTDDTYERRSTTFKYYDAAEDKWKDAVFDLSNTAPETDNYTLYLGWYNYKGVYDGAERKEIASVEIQPLIVETIPYATGSQATPPEVNWYYKASPSDANHW